MYKIQFLELAKKDMIEIMEYISVKLKSPKSANKLAEKMIEKVEHLSKFPYSNKVYHTVKPLKNEYRELIVDNFIIFYFVEEYSKTVIISRVVYAKRDLKNIID